MVMVGGDVEELGFLYSWWAFRFYDICCGKQDGEFLGNVGQSYYFI